MAGPGKGARMKFAVAALALSLPSLCVAADWPQFLGPGGDGTSVETDWNQDWRKKEPEVLWRAEVGTGCSSLAVANGLAFTLGHVRGKKDTVWCLDAGTGEVRWKKEYDQDLEPLYYSGGPSATPLVAGDKLYVLGKDGDLRCLESATGAEVWMKSYTKDFGGREPKWGYAASPLLVNGLLICEPGGAGASVVALDPATGEVKWKAGSDPAAYATPRLFAHGSGRGLAFLNTNGLVARDVAAGTELFRVPWTTPNDVNAATPTVHDGHVLLTADYGKGTALFKTGPGAPTVVWKDDDLILQFQNTILHEGNVYCVHGGNTERASLRCIEFLTGRTRWKERVSGNRGSVLLAGGKLIVLSDAGELVLAEADPAGYRELGTVQVNKKTCWAPPSLANGLLYTRNNDGKVACVDLRAR